MDNRQTVIAYNTKTLFSEIRRCHAIDTSDPRGNTDYSTKHLPRIIQLMKNGVNLSATENNYTPIRLAVGFNLWDVVGEIAKHVGNNQKDENGFDYALIHAVSYNTLVAAKFLLKAGADPSQYFDYRSGGRQIRRNCLHLAILNKNRLMLEALLHYAKDNDFSFLDAEGRTPLIFAIQNKEDKLAILIITHSKLIDNSEIALAWSVKYKFHNLIQLLLQKGAKQISFFTNKKGDVRNFPLHIAVMNNDPISLKLLIAHGGDVNQTNGKANDVGLTPYQLACKKDHGQCTKILLDMQVIQFNHASKIAFEKAVKKKKLDVADAIVRATIGPNHLSTKDDGNTVLHSIVKSWVSLGIHAESMFLYALKHGVKLSALNHLNQTPLELAGIVKNWQVIKLCLDTIKKLKVKKLHCEQILHEAIKDENYVIVLLLLKRGVPCDAYDMQMGNIALCLAVNSKNHKILDLLLMYGADPSMTTQRGMTIYDLAAETKNVLCMEVLNNYQCRVQNKKMDTHVSFLTPAPLPSVTTVGLFPVNNRTKPESHTSDFSQHNINDVEHRSESSYSC